MSHSVLSASQFYGTPFKTIKSVVEHEDAHEHLMDPSDRLTCSTCRTWATDTHTSSDKHWDKVGRLP